ncbi:restriction endonuclease subunit S [Salinibacterium sp. SWN1162]|uniref:restriction endonuclease subunit S n=1 Tax=Salinibacterium sp. SWN1162 TaxID=2792053 RepID=UPI0018CD6C8A|nr:restriction endonuclease subunit S [Salinibacterium sp. SWN1162]MBH0007957.1 restriction endonuclease subunit S [Salinibacterium sp. SWN1162]
MTSERRALVGSSWADFTLLSLTLGGIIPRDLVNIVGKMPADFTTYQVVETNDIVFCLFDVQETPRTVGLARERGMITGAYTVMEVTDRDAYARFVEYVYLSFDQRKALRPLYAGLRNTIRRTDFRNILIPFPSRAEQITIAEFLDRETAEIDAFIADQEELVGLLAERRAATINHAVTNGLDPAVPVKESGLDWLGQVPAGWKIEPLWSLFERKKDVGHPTETMLSVFRGYGVVVKDDFANINKTAENRNIYQLVGPGWLVTNRMKAWQGSVGISSYEGIVSGHYLCFAPIHAEFAPFLNYLFRSAAYTAAYATLSRGVRVGQAEIDNDHYRLLPVLLPPFEAQREIVEAIDQQLSSIDAAITDARGAIFLSRERRAALISAAVTGKIDVREHGAVA